MILRTAVRADVPAILELLADDDLNPGRGGVVAEDADAAYWAAFEAIDADPRNELIVADDNGVLVGTCQLTFTPSLAAGAPSG